MALSNTSLANTFNQWRVNTNLVTDRVNTIAPSANTISANSVTSNTLTINGSLTIPNASIAATKVTFLANTNTYINTKEDKATANSRLANTNSYIGTKLNTSSYTTADVQAKAALANTNAYIATMITVANTVAGYIAKTAGGISSNTYFGAGVVDKAAIGASAVGEGELADSSVSYNKLNANTAHTDRNNNFTVAQRGTISDLGVYHGLAGNTVSLTLTNANHYKLTTNANLTVANPTLTNSVGQSGSLTFTSNGSYTVSWGSYWRFATGTAPTFSTTAGKQDRVDYYVYSSNTIHAVATIDLLGTA